MSDYKSYQKEAAIELCFAGLKILCIAGSFALSGTGLSLGIINTIDAAKVIGENRDVQTEVVAYIENDGAFLNLKNNDKILLDEMHADGRIDDKTFASSVAELDSIEYKMAFAETALNEYYRAYNEAQENIDGSEKRLLGNAIFASFGGLSAMADIQFVSSLIESAAGGNLKDWTLDNFEGIYDGMYYAKKAAEEKKREKEEKLKKSEEPQRQ